MTQDIAALIRSRICHDLISPIGAIGNGVQLLAMSCGAAGAEMDLITESVQNANARIRFFSALHMAPPKPTTRSDDKRCYRSLRPRPNGGVLRIFGRSTVNNHAKWCVSRF